MTQTAAGLRHEIGTARDLESVVRTMKVLAAASIGEYETSVHALADYYRTVELALGASLRHLGPTPPSPKEEGRSRRRRIAVVVFGSDQGLVGAFNEVVADHAMDLLERLGGPAKVWAIGERLYSRLVDGGLEPAGLFEVPRSVKGIAPLVGGILRASEGLQHDGGMLELHLCHHGRAAGGANAPLSRQVLPLDDAWRRRLVDVPWPTHWPPQILGNGTRDLAALVREYVFVTIFRACAESLAAENASRLVAMERAERNIGSRLQDLHRSFHRLRQAGIDEELFDVVAGYEALAGGAATPAR